MPTPQQLIAESREELKKYQFTQNILSTDFAYSVKLYKRETNEYRTIQDLIDIRVTSLLDALIEERRSKLFECLYSPNVTRVENEIRVDREMSYNNAKQDTISLLKTLKANIAKTNEATN